MSNDGFSDEGESYAFESHEDVVRAVHLLEANVLDNIPPYMWLMQREQLRTAVRNHLETFGQDTSDVATLRSALYGAMLAINLESQSSVISVQTVLLAATLLDMAENPIAVDGDRMDAMRDLVESTQKRRRPSGLLRAVRRITGAFDG